jgi:hypothetical protein
MGPRTLADARRGAHDHAMTVLSDAIVSEHQSYQGRIDEPRRIADECDDERPTALLGDLDDALVFVAKEEELYLPLLERSLADDDAARLLDAMRGIVHHHSPTAP